MRLISPVFTKELTQFAASRKMFVIKCVYLGLCLLGVAIVLKTTGDEYSLTEVGVALASMISLCSVAASFMIIPFMAVGTVFDEHRANTLPLLFLTQLTPFNIAQDKVFSRVVQATYIIALVMPVFACVLLLGGVDAQQIYASIGYILGSILIASSLAVIVSAFVKNFAAALVVCFLLEGLYLIGTLVFAEVTDAIDEDLFSYLHPIGVAIVYFGRGGVEYLEASMVFLGVSFTTYLVAILVSTKRIAQLRRGTATSLPVRRPTRDDPLERMILRSIPEQSGVSPIFWRDRYVAPDLLLRMSRRMIWGIMALAVLMFTYYVHKKWDGDDYLVMVTMPATLITLGLFCVIGANVVSGEKHRNTLPVLLSTLLSQKDIFKGYLKVMGSLVLDGTAVVFAICAFTAYLGVYDYGYDYDQNLMRETSILGSVIVVGLLASLCWIIYPMESSSGYRCRLWCAIWFTFKMTLLTSSIFILALAHDQITWIIVIWPLFSAFAIMFSFTVSLRCKNQVRALAWAVGGMMLICLGPFILMWITDKDTWIVLSPVFWVVGAAIQELGQADDNIVSSFFALSGYICLTMLMYFHNAQNLNRILGRQEDGRL
jgi:hypothetical protein